MERAETDEEVKETILKLEHEKVQARKKGGSIAANWFDRFYPDDLVCCRFRIWGPLHESPVRVFWVRVKPTPIVFVAASEFLTETAGHGRLLVVKLQAEGQACKFQFRA